MNGISSDKNSGDSQKWQWVEAFYKFGFDDGDGKVETGRIARLLKAKGFKTKIFKWRPHNTIIVSIKKDDAQCMPDKYTGYHIGYHNPQEYLPIFLIEIMDTAFPPTTNFLFPLSRVDRIGG